MLSHAKECVRLPANPQKLGERHEAVSPTQPHKEPAQTTPWSQTSGLQSCGTTRFCCLCCPACGLLLWQPSQTNTPRQTFLRTVTCQHLGNTTVKGGTLPDICLWLLHLNGSLPQDYKAKKNAVPESQNEILYWSLQRNRTNRDYKYMNKLTQRIMEAGKIQDL